MKMKNRNGSHLSTDLLQVSTLDTVELSKAVEERFGMVCAAYLKIKGIELIPSDAIEAEIVRWRMMVVRHRQGDGRNTRSELLALRRVAEWIHETNCGLRNQPVTVIEWKD
jgi:hypothetical protein